MLAIIAHKVRNRLALIPFGSARECCLCGARLGRFLPYQARRSAPRLMKAVRIVGSNLDYFYCPACNCHDRERHLLLYLRRLKILEQMRGASILHFAPEAKLTPFITRAGPDRHVLADLHPSAPGIERIDLLAIPYPAAMFDFVIANHVLEHVADDARALSEIRRVLKKGGHAILQTPYSSLLESTWCDNGVKSPEDRLQIFGQDDHTRLYGRDIFARIVAAGFVSRVVQHAQVMPEVDPASHGVNPEEPLFLFEAN